MENREKVYGRPLQDLYKGLLKLPQAPRQPEWIRDLGKTLQEEGLSYHPRTLKRQLLGSIEYIPGRLEEAFLEHLKAKPIPGQKKLLEGFGQAKSALENSSDDSLYVSPKFLTQMADAYLYRHKGLSRRRLALSLSESLEKRGISIGLETLQAALSSKTQKVRKVLEEELLGYFRAEGFADRAAVEAYLNESEDASGRSEVRKVEVGDLSQWSDAYLLKHPGLSRRQLALQVRNRLEAKGYVYHLSSIQSVLEGKTRKTRQVIVETLKELLESEGVDTDATALEPAEASRLDWSHYVSAEGIPNQVQALLGLHPGLTRRQVALKLQEDLRAKGFHFSLSTLQYLLAGKTQRVKKVVVDLLDSYAQPGGFPEPVKVGRHSFGAGRQALQKRVEESLERYRMADGAEREARKELFQEARWELIRRVALKRQAPVVSNGRRKKDFLAEHEGVDGYYESNADSSEIPVAYDVQESFSRLVS